MSSTNSDFAGVLGELPGLNFAEGEEVVDNATLADFLSTLGVTDFPTAGDTEYTLGSFFSMIMVFSGDHTIELEATDMDGNVKKGHVVLTVE